MEEKRICASRQNKQVISDIARPLQGPHYSPPKRLCPRRLRGKEVEKNVPCRTLEKNSTLKGVTKFNFLYHT